MIMKKRVYNKKSYGSCGDLFWGIFFLNVYFTFQLELKLGLGGTSYADFIQSMHLPMQLRYGTYPPSFFICDFF